MNRILHFCLLFIFLFLIGVSGKIDVTRKTKSLNVHRMDTFRGLTINDTNMRVTGVGTGGIFAILYSFSQAKNVKEVGAFSGAAVWGCHEMDGLSGCHHQVSLSTAQVTSFIYQHMDTGRFMNGTIHDHLRQQSIVLLSHLKSKVVRPSAVSQAADMYHLLNVHKLVHIDLPDANIGLSVNHDQGVDCSLRQSPFLLNCHFDALSLFDHLPSLPLSRYFFSSPSSFHASINNLTFKSSSTSFGQYFEIPYSGPSPSLAKFHYAYVPDRCQHVICHLHIHFHPCKVQSQHILRDYFHDYIEKLHLSSSHIHFFPQIQASYKPTNVRACFDYYGYSSPNYLSSVPGSQLYDIHEFLLHLLHD